MSRIRSIKPEFFTSEQVVECSTNARLLFVGMWCFCDDGGIHPASTKRLKMEVFPADNFSTDEIGEMVAELKGVGLLEEYEVSGERYWRVTGWKHQKIDRPNFKYPNPDAPEKSATSPRALVERSSNDSPNTRRTLVEQSPPEGKGREGIGEEGNKTPSVPGKPETGGDGTSGNILHLESKLEAKERRLSEVTSEAVETYNLAPFTKRNGGDCPNVSLITDERKKNVGRCLKVASAITEKLTGSPTITRTFWERYWETVSEDPFASGRSKGSGAHANWKPDFEYLTRPDVMGKLFDRAMSEAGVAHG